MTTLDPFRSSMSDVKDLINHPAIATHGAGIATTDLADFIRQFAELTADRVSSIGADQYGQGKLQAFESKDPHEIFQEIVEELADVIAYVAMLAIKAGVVVR